MLSAVFGLDKDASLFDQWWQQQGEWVEAPNRRRGGESGVQRLRHVSDEMLYAKRQVDHLYRSLLHPFGRPTVLRERNAMLGLSKLGVRVPHLIYCGAHYQAGEGWRAILISEALEGFVDIDNWYAQGGAHCLSAAQHEQLLQQIGATLARMHLGRWQHGCLYAKHVFVRVQGDVLDVALLDLEKSRRRLTCKSAAQHDMRQLRRHSPWSDVQWQQVLHGYQQVFGSSIKGI